MRKWTSKKKMDRCVICGKETKYAKSVPIDERIGYIQGSGQLCRRCFTEIYRNR